MYEEAVELLLQGVVVLGYAVVAVVFAGLGAFFEYRSYLFLDGGEALLSAWMGGLGLVLLAFAFLIVRDKLPATVRDALQ